MIKIMIIMIKELVPVVLSWGPQLARNRVLFQCNNTRVVAAIKKRVELAMYISPLARLVLVQNTLHG